MLLYVKRTLLEIYLLDPTFLHEMLYMNIDIECLTEMCKTLLGMLCSFILLADGFCFVFDTLTDWIEV